MARTSCWCLNNSAEKVCPSIRPSVSSCQEKSRLVCRWYRARVILLLSGACCCLGRGRHKTKALRDACGLGWQTQSGSLQGVKGQRGTQLPALAPGSQKNPCPCGRAGLCLTSPSPWAPRSSLLLPWAARRGSGGERFAPGFAISCLRLAKAEETFLMLRNAQRKHF